MKGSGSKWAAGIFVCGLMAVSATPAMAADTPAGGVGGTFNIFFHIMDWMVITVLVLCSIAVVALVIDAIMRIRESKICPPETTEHLRTLITSRQFKELMDFTATDNTFVSQSIYAGVRRAHLKYPAMREAMDSTMGEQTSDIYRRIEFLNVIGNIGPLIGLLGTVLGMIIAFYALGAAGGDKADPGKLAGGISTALWHTFGGLFVAIPALVVYGFYRTRIDKITTKASLIAEELLEMLRPESAAAPVDDNRARRKPATVPSPVPQPQVAE